MNKHEEAREMVIWGRIIHQDTEKARETLLDYITEQEKKDELLGLYRELHETQDMITYENVLEQIKDLEEEMKDVHR